MFVNIQCTQRALVKTCFYSSASSRQHSGEINEKPKHEKEKKSTSFVFNLPCASVFPALPPCSAVQQFGHGAGLWAKDAQVRRGACHLGRAGH